MAETGIADRLARIEEGIARACARVGRHPAEVTLVGASKQQSLETLAAAHQAGLKIFGENRVQEAITKARSLPSSIEWHLIGPLQTNKARVAAELFHTVHSVDRLRVAEALAAEIGRLGKRLPCFVEINLGEEESKHGFSPVDLPAQLEPIARLEALRVVGLMAIPPFGDTPEDSRPWFRRLRKLAEEVAATGLFDSFESRLSMGMSDDFEVAIEEGATHVRVGTALFGARTPRPEQA